MIRQNSQFSGAKLGKKKYCHIRGKKKLKKSFRRQLEHLQAIILTRSSIQDRYYPSQPPRKTSIIQSLVLFRELTISKMQQ
jgi:hypothetical protein